MYYFAPVKTLKIRLGKISRPWSEISEYFNFNEGQEQTVRNII